MEFAVADDTGVLFVSVHIIQHQAAALSCYQCTGVTRVSDCQTTVTCNQDNSCYHDRVFGAGGYTRELGCRRTQDCKSTPSSVVGRRFLLDNGTDTPLCTECCDSDGCNAGLCGSAVDGAFTDWTAWTNCDVTCDNGTQSRSRSCTNPSPQNGGQDCVGLLTESQSCQQAVCPVQGGWSNWSQWGTCSESCGPGLQSRDRTCSNPKPGNNNGDPCSGESKEYKVCPPVACADGGWSDWSPWSACTVTCGNGFKTRSRDCSNPEPSIYGKTCRGQPNEISSCNNKRCPAAKASFTVDHPKALVDYHLTFSNVIFNQGNDFNQSSGIFNCSKPGVYMFTFILVKKRTRDTETPADYVACYLRKNNNDYFLRGNVNPTDDATDKGSAYAGNSGLVHLDAGETITLTSCTDPVSTMEYWSSFSGFLLYPDDE